MPAVRRACPAAWAFPIEGPERGDAFWIDDLPKQSKMFGFPHVEAFTPDRWLVGR
jgi:hydroxyacylglutathione hydrolase